MMRGYLLIFCLWVWLTPAYGQGETDNLTRHFALQVKQVDEFMERFNNQENTLVKEYVRQIDPSRQLDRHGLILSLFNVADKSWKKEEVLRFVRTVTDSAHPVFLNFYDDDWFAELHCSGVYKSKPVKLKMIMKIQREQGNASKWIIAGAKADFLCLPVTKDSMTFLHPMSHAVDFSGVDRVWGDIQNIHNYLPAQFQYNVLSVFAHAITSKALSLKQIDSITYHFIQVEGWAFTLNYYNRPGGNSGWLISKLTPTTYADKNNYRDQLINKNK